MEEKEEIKIEGLPPFSKEDLYFVGKLISHLVPDSSDIIQNFGWAEACKDAIQRVNSLNRHYFHSANLNKSKSLDYWPPDDNTEF